MTQNQLQTYQVKGFIHLLNGTYVIYRLSINAHIKIFKKFEV